MRQTSPCPDISEETVEYSPPRKRFRQLYLAVINHSKATSTIPPHATRATMWPIWSFRPSVERDMCRCCRCWRGCVCSRAGKRDRAMMACTAGINEESMQLILMRATRCLKNSSRGQSSGLEQKPRASVDRGIGALGCSKDNVRAWCKLGAWLMART